MQWRGAAADGRTLAVEDTGDPDGRPGPHLLACVALLQDLVVAAACLASSAPYDAVGLDWFADMGPEAAAEAALMFTDRVASRALFEQEREHMLAVSPAELAGQLRLTAGEDPGFFLDEALCMQQAYAPGIEGRRDEDVPFGHGQWLATHIPDVEARFFDHEGHGSLRGNQIGEVHAWLAGRL